MGVNQEIVKRKRPKHGVRYCYRIGNLPEMLVARFQLRDVLADVLDRDFMFRELLLEEQHVLHRDAVHPLWAAVEDNEFHGNYAG